MPASPTRSSPSSSSTTSILRGLRCRRAPTQSRDRGVRGLARRRPGLPPPAARLGGGARARQPLVFEQAQGPARPQVSRHAIRRGGQARYRARPERRWDLHARLRHHRAPQRRVGRARLVGTGRAALLGLRVRDDQAARGWNAASTAGFALSPGDRRQRSYRKGEPSLGQYSCAPRTPWPRANHLAAASPASPHDGGPWIRPRPTADSA